MEALSTARWSIWIETIGHLESDFHTRRNHDGYCAERTVFSTIIQFVKAGRACSDLIHRSLSTTFYLQTRSVRQRSHRQRRSVSPMATAKAYWIRIAFRHSSIGGLKIQMKE